ncbi:uncharacterized protein LOC126159513 [Schistocerca cancellata]|uniref:uncharacterized protein LOC126159513 n=1 Tax=Schistocerca cancellata TaxID=274614 RepID=UPI0021174B5F|nr:uncharacterized protein LOC126159513 [Schistocerca cancellata]
MDNNCVTLRTTYTALSPRVREKFPVLVFIHGESYEWNSGNPYDGTTLASFGRIIVITLNFRLGILGFLRPEFGPDSASNLGLLDQIAALQWIKDNIAAFDGDPTNVTLMGHDTGAACVNLLLVSPITEQADGGWLFQRAILMSGSALSDWALTANPRPVTIQVADALNCPTQNELLACLRRQSLEDLMAVQVKAAPFVSPFAPVVDGTSVPNDPEQIMGVYHSLFSRYDLMYGVTQIESYQLFGKEALVYGILEKVCLETLKDYMQARFQIRTELAVGEAQALYSRGDWDAPLDAEDHRDALLHMLTDARVVAPVVRTGDYHSRVNDRSYFYVFTHRTVYGDYSNSKPQGSISGEELAYVFGAPVEGSRHQHPHIFTPSERILSENVMTLWTNFAKTGNPNEPHPVTSNEPVVWPKYDREGQRFLQIGNLCTSLFRENFPSSQIITDLNHYSYLGTTHITVQLLPTSPAVYQNTLANINGTSIKEIDYCLYHMEFAENFRIGSLSAGMHSVAMGLLIDDRLSVGKQYRRRYTDFWNRVLPEKLNKSSRESFPNTMSPYGPARAPHPDVQRTRPFDPHYNFEKPFGASSGNRWATPQPPGGGVPYGERSINDPPDHRGANVSAADKPHAAEFREQRDKLRVQQQLMRQRYEDVTALATSDEDDAGERYVHKKADAARPATSAAAAAVAARVATVDRRLRRKKELIGADDDYEAIRSAGRTVEGAVAVAAPEAALPAEDLPLAGAAGAGAVARRSAWGAARQYSGSTMDPHTKVREWIAQEIVQRYSPRFLRRAKKTESHAPVLQSSQSIQTSFDQVSTSTATPRQLKRQHAIETAEVAVSATPADVSGHGSHRSRPKKVSVAIDATPSGRGSSVEHSISKSMDELGTCVSTSMLTLKKPALKRSLTMAEDLAVASTSISPRSSSSGELLSRSTANISLKYTLPNQQAQNLDIVRVAHAHSRSDPAASSNPHVPSQLSGSMKSGHSQPAELHAVNISLDPHTSPSVIYVPGGKKQQLQTFPAGIQLRSKALPKKDVAITATPIPVDVNVTSRDSNEEETAHAGDPLSNIQKRKFPKVLPDFPQDAPANEVETMAAQAANFKRRSLPPNSLFMALPVSEVPGSQSSSVASSAAPSKDIPGKSSLTKVPPPPPPRISSTLGRKPANTAPITPLPTIPAGTVPVHTSSEKKTQAAAEVPVAATASAPSHYQRIEPRVIIKPTITSPQTKKAQAARGLQSIPRVTPSDPVTHPAPGPPSPRSPVQMDKQSQLRAADPYVLPVARQLPTVATVHQAPSSPQQPLQSLPVVPEEVNHPQQQSAVAFVAPQQKAQAKQTAAGKQAPSSPGKKRLQPVLKVVAETSTDPFEDTDSSTGTVKRVKRPAAKAAQGQTQTQRKPATEAAQHASPKTTKKAAQQTKQQTAAQQSTQPAAQQVSPQTRPAAATASATTSTSELSSPLTEGRAHPPKKWYKQYQHSFVSKSEDDQKT